MDIAQPGFEPRACRDIGVLSYFEQCIVTPLPVKSMLRAVCTVAHVGARGTGLRDGSVRVVCA